MTQIQIIGLKRFTQANYNEVYYKMSFTLPASFGTGANPIFNLANIVASYNSAFYIETIPVTGTILSLNGTYNPPSGSTLAQIESALQAIYATNQTTVNGFTLSPYDSLAGLSWDGASWSTAANIVDNPLNATNQANLGLTATGLASAAVTLSIPAVPSKYHCISLLEITAYSIAARTGGTTPVIVTTTNLSGSNAFTFGSAAAIGTTDRIVLSSDYPIKSLVANTATTIVAPATTSIIWRINTFYSLSN